MAEEKVVEKTTVINKNISKGSGAVYGLGLVGAGIYFIQQANTFLEGVIGILKAIVWPAFLVYGILDFLKL